MTGVNENRDGTDGAGGPEPDGFGHEESEPEREPDSYPYSIDRRYHSHVVTPVGWPTVDELAGSRGEPDPEGDPDLVEPGEMACLLKGRANATQVLIDQGAKLGAMTNGLSDAYHRAEAALLRLRSDTARYTKLREEGDTKADELRRRFAHVSPERKLPAPVGLRWVVYCALTAFAVLDMWFFHKFVAVYWRLSPTTEQWQIWVFGPLLGLLVAFMVWLSGRVLGRRLWYLRAGAGSAPERPRDHRQDGSPRPWYERATRVTSWRAGRLARHGFLPLLALGLGLWTLFIVGLFGYYRALDDLVRVPEVSVAVLIVTLGLGAMLLEAVAQNPYAEAMDSDRRAIERARLRAGEAVEEASEALSELTQFSDVLQRRRDEAMGLARIEMDRAWNTAVLPSRHRSGRSGASAPAPAVLEGAGAGVHRLSRVPTDQETEAFFRTFAGIPVPPPALGPVTTANDRLREFDPGVLRSGFEELTALLDPSSKDAEGSEGTGGAESAAEERSREGNTADSGETPSRGEGGHEAEREMA
jgi:hypothetical protein